MGPYLASLLLYFQNINHVTSSMTNDVQRLLVLWLSYHELQELLGMLTTLKVQIIFIFLTNQLHGLMSEPALPPATDWVWG